MVIQKLPLNEIYHIRPVPFPERPPVVVMLKYSPIGARPKDTISRGDGCPARSGCAQEKSVVARRRVIEVRHCSVAGRRHVNGKARARDS
jgi:hypothetical protein